MARLFVLSAVSALTLAAAPTALAVAAFVTPNRAAYCGVSEGEPPLRLICWRPGDGFTLDMRRLGRARGKPYARNRGYYGAAGRALRFGQAWSVRGYWKCVSRRTGLTCTNHANHGWWLGLSRGYRLF